MWSHNVTFEGLETVAMQGYFIWISIQPFFVAITLKLSTKVQVMTTVVLEEKSSGDSDPVVVSVVSSIPSGGRQLFAEFF